MLDDDAITDASANTHPSVVTRHRKQHAPIGGDTGCGGGEWGGEGASGGGGVKEEALWRRLASSVPWVNRAKCDCEWCRCVLGRPGRVLVPWERGDSNK